MESVSGSGFDRSCSWSADFYRERCVTHARTHRGSRLHPTHSPPYGQLEYPSRCVLLQAGQRERGIEPPFRAWEARVLPLNYSRIQELRRKQEGASFAVRCASVKSVRPGVWSLFDLLTPFPELPPVRSSGFGRGSRSIPPPKGGTPSFLTRPGTARSWPR